MSKKAFIGRKLREARMYRGKTIDVLAKETNINKKDIIALATSMKKIDFTSLLNEVACPAFIICGQKDRANQNAARILANTIPNAKLSFVESAGHEVNIDAPVTLADLIKEAWFYE